jgi:hypothetical protein
LNFLSGSSFEQILVFKLSHLFKSHCWLISILLPNLSNQFFLLFSGAHTMLDLFLCRNLPNLHLWDRLV